MRRLREERPADAGGPLPGARRVAGRAARGVPGLLAGVSPDLTRVVLFAIGALLLVAAVFVIGGEPGHSPGIRWRLRRR